MTRSLAKLAALLAPLLLAACDHTTFPWSSAPDAPPVSTEGNTGGGGGGGGGIPQDFSMSTTALHVSATAGGAAPDPQTFTVRAKPATWIRLQPLDPWIQSADVTTTLAGDRVTLIGTVTVRFAAPDGWPIGTRTGSLVVTGCVDAACTDTAYGSPARLDVTYEVRPATLSASPAALSVTWRQGGPAPDPMATDLRVDSGGSGAATYTIAYDAPTSVSWLSWADGVDPSPTAPQTLRLAVHPEGLAADTYTARIRATALGATVDVPVTLTVEPQPDPALAAAPSQLSFTVTGATTPADATRTVALSDRGTPVPFTATAPAWLRVSPASGTTATAPTLTVSIDPERVVELGNGAHAGEIALATVDLTGAPTTARIPVALDLELSRVTGVTPWVIAAGDARPVVLRGRGFAAGTPPVVRFGTEPATEVQIVSDTVAYAVPPALAPGRHLVQVDDALGLPPSVAALEVVPVRRVAGAFAPTGAYSEPEVIVRDDVRGAIYAVEYGSALLRFRDETGWAREALPMTGVSSVALTPDGSRLVAVAAGQIWEIDPVAFTLPAAASASVGSGGNWRIAFANDGVGVLGLGGASDDCHTYDLATKRVATTPGCWTFSAAPVSAGDGRRVILRQETGVRTYDASTSTMEGYLADVLAATPVGAPSVDRTGSRLLVVDRYQRNPSTLLQATSDSPYVLEPIAGRLPATTQAAILSSDGTRVYTYDDWTVRVFDVRSPMADPNAVFPELGTPGGIVPVVSPGYVPRLALSADERTLYLVATTIVAVPLD